MPPGRRADAAPVGNLTVRPLSIAAVMVITPRRRGDGRGYFFESYRADDLARVGIAATFVQDNHAMSAQAGTIRGLHFQVPPKAQAKLVRVLKGSIFDVALDLRRGSLTYGQWVAATLTAEGGEQIFVPRGFAHGYCTLEPDTEVAYKISDFYAPEHEAGIAWNDPRIGIDWPLGGAEPILSEKDARLPRLADARLDP